MKRLNKFIFMVFALVVYSPVLSADENGEGSKLNVGPSKAVLEADKEKGLRLSKQALENLRLKFQPVASGNVIEISQSAIVHFQDFTGVYRFRQNWFKLVEVDLLSTQNGKVTFQSKEFVSGDQVVVQGSSFLRATDMDIWGPQADSCVD